MKEYKSIFQYTQNTCFKEFRYRFEFMKIENYKPMLPDSVSKFKYNLKDLKL